MNVPIEMIKQLRDQTRAGVLDCHKALERSELDYGKALGYLREQGLEKAAKRAEAVALQGVIELYSHGSGRIGVMVEINTETDFAARSTAFRAFAHEIALQIAAASPRFVRDEDIPQSVIAEEAKKAADRAIEEGKPEQIIPRIVEGTLRKFKNQTVLLRQEYIRDEELTIAELLNKTIAAVGENIVIRRFQRWELTENEPE